MNPAQYVALLQFAITAIQEVVGINPEMMGMVDRMQPGVVEHQRKQAAMTILAGMFDSFRQFQKNVGRVRQFYIQNYLSNGQLILIVGAEGKQLIPLVRDKVLGQYIVVVDDAPTSANEQEAAWEAIKSVLPVIGGALDKESVSLMLDYMPLPPQLKIQFKQAMAKPNPQADAAARLALMTGMAKLEQLKAQTMKTLAETGTEKTAALEN